MPDPILDDLTPPQREAVAHLRGPMLVVAGAGSGKTRVVTRRVAHLIRSGARPGQILAMTFTNKAAGEMRERVQQLCGAAPGWIGTFHSMCARFLRRDLEKLGDGRSGDFSIYDDDDQKGLLKQIIKDLKYDEKQFQPRKVAENISRAKCAFKTPEEYGAGSWFDEQTAKMYAEYEKRLRRQNAADFDDLLVLTVRLLRDVPKLAEIYHDRFRHLLIDEYQDTNRVQYLLMRLLCGPEHNVHVTGDPDQSIYSWRGAEYRNIMDFQSDFPDARIVRLEQNYRSTQRILDAANAVIANNSYRMEKSLFTENPTGEPIVAARLPDDRAEADWVVGQIGQQRQTGRNLREVAVFYRTNGQSRSFEEAFMRAGLPYQIVGGVRFYERKEIKDLLAHLRLMVNPRDLLSLARVIGCRPTGVGEKTMAKLNAAADEQGTPAFLYLVRGEFGPEIRATKALKEFAAWCGRLHALPRAPLVECVREVLRVSGLVEHIESRSEQDPAAEDRLENLESFVGRAAEFAAANAEADLAGFLEDVALVADVDAWDRSAEAVSLMTLHSAKGLEFPCVFLVGLEEGLLPHQGAMGAGNVEEERRLFYVGLTRAREQAFLSHATTRFQWGRLNMAPPSQFLAELPEDELEVVDLDDSPLTAPGLSPDRVTPLMRWKGGAQKSVRRNPGTDADPWPDEDFGDVFADEDFAPDAAFPDDFGDDFGPEPAPPPSRSRTPRSGELVNHPTFGKGKVLAVSGREATIHFFTGGTKKLHLDVARLTPG